MAALKGLGPLQTMAPHALPPVDPIKIAGLKHGLMIYGRRTASGRNGDWIMVSPPMTMSRSECDELLRGLTATVLEFESNSSGIERGR